MKELTFKQKLEDHCIDVSSFDGMNYSHMRSPIGLQLAAVFFILEKYELKAYNFSFHIGDYGSPMIEFDFCGEYKNIHDYHDDDAKYCARYVDEMKKVVDNVPKGSAPKVEDLIANAEWTHSASEYL